MAIKSSKDFQKKRVESNIITDLEHTTAKVLCPHCKRTKDNGLSCIGMCVADNEY